MYQRTLEKTILDASETFPVILVTGPRQVGKTTLLEMCSMGKRNYVSLDDFDARQLAKEDPGLFVQTYKPPLIIDEVQYAPELFSYIKIAVDKKKQNGLYWLTGSQKFNLMQGKSESLAGRVAIVDLLGLSNAEIEGIAVANKAFIPEEGWMKSVQEKYPKLSEKNLLDVYERIWLGSFPRVHQNQGKNRDLFYRSYVQTYIQRDVKDTLNITDDTAFNKFLGVVAARTGQLLNYAELARDVAIDNKTAKSWLSILEASGLVYLLQPYFSNMTKRLVKSPKLYFLDTGLCCYLTKWPDPASLEAGAMSGAILESYLFAEILKSYWHNGKEAHFYYYRDKDQKEIDLVIDAGSKLYPIEFKKTGTPSKTAAKNFSALAKLGKEVGTGSVFCFVEQTKTLAKDVIAIPISYL